jgi:protein-tyrosine phosphatase
MTAVDLQGAYNVRDLGGLMTADGRATVPGLLYRGDSLDRITPDDAALLFGDLRIGTVIDLRTRAETELLGESRSPVPRYRFSLLSEGSLGTEPFPSDDPEELAKVYNSNLDGGRAAIRNSLEIMAENLKRGVPTLFHCAAGRDRTGVVAAVVLGLAGVTDEQIAADYVRSNRNARLVTRKLEENPLYANNHDRPDVILLHKETILGFLRLLREEHGGPLQFCLDSGVEPETAAAFGRYFVAGPSPDAG